MGIAFGDSRTIPASNEVKKIMEQLFSKGIVNQKRDIWKLGASLGIAMGKTYDKDKRETFENINSLDPDEVFSAVMLGLYPKLSPDERVKKLVDHAEWGVREIFRKYNNGTLDWATLGVVQSD